MDKTNLDELVTKADLAELEITNIERALAELKVGQVELNEVNITPELAELQSENRRLKYQIVHLKRSIEKEEAMSSNHMISILGKVTDLFQEAIDKSYPSVENCKKSVTPTNKEKFGDYQCSSAKSIAKTLESKNESPKLTALEIANKIVANFPENQIIEKTDVAPSGFINVFLKKTFVSPLVSDIIKNGVCPPDVGPKKKIIVDMSSPNIAKEMHVGHLRSTIIGESVSQLNKFLGHNILKLNHLGDWGTQFGMLIAHLQDKFPDYRTVSPSIGDLQAFYKESKKRFDSDEDFKKRAYAAVVQLQSHDVEHIKAWKLICDESGKEFMKIYQRLEIKDLVDRGESFYQPLMIEVVKELEEKKLLVEEEGRKICWAPNVEIPLTIVKSDGGFTYDTSDMAALRHRLQVEKADEILYVVESGQGLHFDGIFSAGRKAGWYDPSKTRVEHIGFGVVLGDDKKKFKTRSGVTIRLVDLMDEGIKRAGDKLVEKKRDQELSSEELTAAKEAVAYGCIKYADLSHCRKNDYIFSFDKMLDDKGNTAVYLQYAFMRIRSIVRQTNVSDEEIKKAASSTEIILEHAKEWKLAKHVVKFTEVISKCSEDLMFHTLCDYLYELATIFTEFYADCYVVEKDRKTGDIVKVNMSRLLLLQATADIMKQGFVILGLRAVDRM